MAGGCLGNALRCEFERCAADYAVLRQTLLTSHTHGFFRFR
jgi:hypothetical protein